MMGSDSSKVGRDRIWSVYGHARSFGSGREMGELGMKRAGNQTLAIDGDSFKSII